MASRRGFLCWQLIATTTCTLLLFGCAQAFPVTNRPSAIKAITHRRRGATATPRQESFVARHQISPCTTPNNKEEKPIARTSTLMQLRLRRKILQICLPIVLATAATSLPASAAAASSSSSSSLPATLGKTQLLLASLLVATTGGFKLWRRGLPDLAKEVMISCIRCSVQLYILGAIILHRLLGATHPGILVAWIFGVGVVAAQQAFSRLDYVYDDLFSHLLISIMGSVLLVLSLSISTNMLGTITPWFAPSTIIPVTGMLFGHAISASSLAAQSLTREFVTGKAALELRLARGASAHEALRPLIRTSLSDALTPTINALAITGVVHMPGMMTGQILAGQNPQQAAAYQTLILFLIASTASISVQLLTQCVTHQLMDFEDVRLVDRLKLKKDLVKASETNQQVGQATFIRHRFAKALRLTPKTRASNAVKVLPTFPTPVVKKFGITTAIEPSSASPLLIVNKLKVQRAGQQISLALGAGDRIAIIGASGSGKTQILRSLAGLEAVDRPESSLRLGNSNPKEMTWPEWRRRVSWISQDRPTVEGTPTMLFEELVSYQSRDKQSTVTIGYPREIAHKWNLEPEVFDQSWATLSGGEAQRAYLAIAIALKPQVLLLDEATSGLDVATQTLVENSLIESQIPIVLVTHSKEQLQRFCTHIMDLDPIKSPLVDPPANVESGLVDEVVAEVKRNETSFYQFQLRYHSGWGRANS